MAHWNPEEVKAKLLSILNQLAKPERQLLNEVLKIEKANLHLPLPHNTDELIDAVKRTIA